MERLNWHIAEELAREFELMVCGPTGSSEHLPRGIGTIEVPLRPLRRFLIENLRRTVSIARRFRPQLVIAGSGLTAPAAWAAARACGALPIAYVHGLDLIADHWLYRLVWLRFIRRQAVVLVNSRNTAILAERCGVAPGRVRLLHPGVDLPAPDEQAAAKFRNRFGLGGRPVLLSLGRLAARKGLAEFIESSLPQVVAAQPDMVFVIIGEEAIDAIKPGAPGQRERIEHAVANAGLDAHVRLLGQQDDEVAAAAFGASTALVFPVLDLPGDVEGFGMVALEAAAHGVSTVAFDVGGIADAVSEPTTGTLVGSGDYATMAAVLIDLLGEKQTAEAAAARRQFAANFAWPLFGSRLRDICRASLAETRALTS